MNGIFLILATFLAATIEGIEMMAILVGVGATRGWRSTLLSAAAGFVLLAVIVRHHRGMVVMRRHRHLLLRLPGDE